MGAPDLSGRRLEPRLDQIALVLKTGDRTDEGVGALPHLLRRTRETPREAGHLANEGEGVIQNMGERQIAFRSGADTT